jgi:hypothetical protein
LDTVGDATSVSQDTDRDAGEYSVELGSVLLAKAAHPVQTDSQNVECLH